MPARCGARRLAGFQLGHGLLHRRVSQQTIHATHPFSTAVTSCRVSTTGNRAGRLALTT